MRESCGRKAFHPEALSPLTTSAVAMSERERDRRGLMPLGPINPPSFPTPCKDQSIKQELGQLWSCGPRANSILAFGHWAQAAESEREKERT